MTAAVPFTTPDRRFTGWKARVPGGRPLATPAVVEGRVFLGGGFGSHEFYAFDALSGERIWEYRTKDDGPTAAVVADGLVAFNTESCELEVLTCDGRPVWKKWLGDPLMSMPAIEAGRVYMAYPDSRGDRRHYLACFDLRSGDDRWRQPIRGEVITAPIIAEDHVYAATLDGAVHCFRANDGTPVWHEAKEATSAPVVWDGRCWFSRREAKAERPTHPDAAQQTEHLAHSSSKMRSSTSKVSATEQTADYLDYRKRAARSPRERAFSAHDGAVGFAFAKGDAKIEQARFHLGHGTVAGIWSYQGSKPFLAHGRLYSAMGDTLKCVDPLTEALLWERPLHERGPAEAELLDSPVTPPVLVNGKVFVATTGGELFCLAQETGEELWRAEVGEPVLFQPAVAEGRVYLATYTGSLICLETGDARDDGWRMWGANAAHNGLVSHN